MSCCGCRSGGSQHSQSVSGGPTKQPSARPSACAAPQPNDMRAYQIKQNLENLDQLGECLTWVWRVFIRLLRNLCCKIRTADHQFVRMWIGSYRTLNQRRIRCWWTSSKSIPSSPVLRAWQFGELKRMGNVGVPGWTSLIRFKFEDSIKTGHLSRLSQEQSFRVWSQRIVRSP